MEFKALPIANGVGDFHVNQFRIHFSLPGVHADARKQLPALVREFTRDFPRFFNGVEKGLKENRAQVTWSTRKHERTPTLRFVMDFQAEGLGLDLPDAHSDWVHVVWQDPGRGFAAQTLKREFLENGDLVMAAVHPLLVPLNAYHFLAGRRSWVFGLAESGMPGWSSGGLQVGRVEGGHFVAHKGGPTPLFYLESAAVERYSNFAYALMEKDPGVLMDIRKTIVELWSTLLANYVQAKGFRLNVGHPKTYAGDDGNSLWLTQPAWRGVYHRETAFKTPQTLHAKKWVKDLLNLHPALKAQSLTQSTFSGFEGGSWGGGGSSGRW